MDRAHPANIISRKEPDIPLITPSGKVIQDLPLPKVTPLRIKCPECGRIYTLYIEDLNQGLHTILGQACPFCKRFLKETDNPEELLVDLEDIKKAFGTSPTQEKKH